MVMLVPARVILAECRGRIPWAELNRLIVIGRMAAECEGEVSQSPTTLK